MLPSELTKREVKQARVRRLTRSRRSGKEDRNAPLELFARAGSVPICWRLLRQQFLRWEVPWLGRGGTLPVRRPSTGRRLSFVVLLFSQLAATTGFMFVIPFMPLYVEQLGVEDPGHAAAWAGLLDAAPAVTMALAAPLWGRLGDRVGQKKMLFGPPWRAR